MKEKILEHYRKTGMFTYSGLYAQYFRTLPNDIAQLGRLVCSQVIHRVTLKEGNTNFNAMLLYGDMKRYSWFAPKCHEDLLITAAAMAAELFRLDERGFTKDRDVESKIVVTCRYVSVLMSAILKAKGIPARSRAGFAPYFKKGISMDHWINQYFCEKENRWITFDADGFYEEAGMEIRQYGIPHEKFNWAAESWIAVRYGKSDGKKFLYADGKGTCGIPALARYLVYDFHALMNNELTFTFLPEFMGGRLDSLSEKELCEFDELAELLLDPDKNFEKLCNIWETKRKFRVLNSPLVGSCDHGAEYKE